MQIDIVNGITRLTAAEGKVLVKDGAVGTEVWLAPSDSPDGWAEVDEALAEVDEVEDMRNALKVLGVEE